MAGDHDAHYRRPSTGDTPVKIEERPHDQGESTIDNAARELVTEQQFDHFACPVDGESENQIWGQSCPKVCAFPPLSLHVSMPVEYMHNSQLRVKMPRRVPPTSQFSP